MTTYPSPTTTHFAEFIVLQIQRQTNPLQCFKLKIIFQSTMTQKEQCAKITLLTNVNVFLTSNVQIYEHSIILLLVHCFSQMVDSYLHCYDMFNSILQLSISFRQIINDYGSINSNNKPSSS